MYIRKVLATGLFAVLLNETVCAQYASTNMVGIKAGAAVTSIHALRNMVIDADYYSNYTFEDKMRVSPIAGLFYNYHKDRKLFGLNIGASYYQMSTNSEYSDIHNLSYTIGYQYHYVGLDAMLKAYPYNGLFCGLAFRAGICLTPENISYESNQDAAFLSDFGYCDSETTHQCLVEKFGGKAEAAVGFSVGYEFENGFSVQGSYFYTFTDLVTTSLNTYGWTERPNRANSFLLTVGYAIGLDGK